MSNNLSSPYNTKIKTFKQPILKSKDHINASVTIS